MMDGYPVVTICGSSKFKDIMEQLYRQLSWAGFIVFGLGGYGHSGDDIIFRDPEIKSRLDCIHLVKIAHSDAIVVVNSGLYMGESTTNEVVFATSRGVDVYRLFTEEMPSPPKDNPDYLQDFVKRLVKEVVKARYAKQRAGRPSITL